MKRIFRLTDKEIAAILADHVLAKEDLTVPEADLKLTRLLGGEWELEAGEV